MKSGDPWRRFNWKLYVEIAEVRGIDISEEIKNLPEYNIFKYVDEKRVHTRLEKLYKNMKHLKLVKNKLRELEKI